MTNLQYLLKAAKDLSCELDEELKTLDLSNVNLTQITDWLKENGFKALKNGKTYRKHEVTLFLDRVAGFLYFY